ncbi:hypothetical protein AAY473_000783 [Plecturocebus cupreus]
MAFHHVGQACLELLISGYLPALASQNVEASEGPSCLRRAELPQGDPTEVSHMHQRQHQAGLKQGF